MGLKRIHIRNYKSIRDFQIELKDMNLLLGENGSGKTNFLSAVKYFYDNLLFDRSSQEVFDNNNALNDKMEIILTFDMERMLVRSRKNLKNQIPQYSNYYKKITRLPDRSGGITLKLSQFKNHQVQWNVDNDTRKLIYNMYPLYFVDTRQIDLVNWEDLWQDIGDLVKVENEVNQKLHNEIRDLVAREEFQLQDKLWRVEHAFDRLSIKVKEFSVRDFATCMAKVFYAGDEFTFLSGKLQSFSNGTNSYNYTCLLLYILFTIGQTKMKEPLIILDEPEISLHFQIIDELCDVMLECADYVNILASTHSSRVVKNILVKENNNSMIYQVYKRGDYSELSLLKMFKQDAREKYFLMDHHVNAFFAKMVLLVEGETELELFQNPYLRTLFPVLKNVEVIKGMSDKVVYRIISPESRRYNIPLVAMLDMDKILEYNYAKRKMTLKQEYFTFNGKESLYYGNLRIDTRDKRKRIETMSQKCRFSYQYPFFSSIDNNFFEFIRLIQDYFQEYSIYPVETTTEGLLVTSENSELLMEYLIEAGVEKPVPEAWKGLSSYHSQINFLRLLLNGKSDFLMKLPQIKGYNPNIREDLAALLEKKPFRKTRWVSEWMEFYFCSICDIKGEKGRQRKFSTLCTYEKKRKQILARFKYDFCELYNLIQFITDKYNT